MGNINFFDPVSTLSGGLTSTSQLGGGSGFDNAWGQATDVIGLTNHSGDKALDAQTSAANQANATQRYIFDQQRADNQPWLQAGSGALSQLSSNNFMKDWQQDPGYQFRLSEGQKAINAAGSARGNAMGGAAMKELTRYGQDFASSEYDKVYNRNSNRLSSLAGFGQNANSQNAQSGQNYGNQVSSNQIGVGNAAAANAMGATNRLSGIVGQVGGAAAGAAFSDERLKINIKKINAEEISEIKQHIKPFLFNYIDDKYGKGDWVGVMAQDLQKTKLGKRIVFQDENGNLKINLDKAVSLCLAVTLGAA